MPKPRLWLNTTSDRQGKLGIGRMKSLLHGLLGVISLSLYVLITLVLGIPLTLLSLTKLVLFRSRYRPLLTRWLDKTGSAWISCNNAHQRLLLPTRLKVTGPLTVKVPGE